MKTGLSKSMTDDIKNIKSFNVKISNIAQRLEVIKTSLDNANDSLAKQQAILKRIKKVSGYSPLPETKPTSHN